MPPFRRRVPRVAAVAATVLAAYAAGVLTGTIGSRADADRHRDEPVAGGVLDEAARRIAESAARPVSREELERAAVQGMLDALDDRWSAYYAPSDFQRFQAVLDGRYTGIGLWVRRGPDGLLRVASVQTGSPAAAAGLRVGDRVVAVNGQPVLGRSVAQLVAELRGGVGSPVSVSVQRGAVVHTVRLRRVDLDDDDVAVEPVGRGVVRIRIAAFTRGVGRAVRLAVARLHARHVGGLVLDLRDDPGGLLDEAVETASAFLDGGPVVSYARRGAPLQHLDALGHGDATMPLVVLVDGATASAAEVVAAALQDRHRAVLLGSRTFGKGSVQEPTRLPDGSAFELTVGRYLTPRGRSLDGTGVEPDILVDPAAGHLAEQRAVQVLSGLLADAGTSGRG